MLTDLSKVRCGYSSLTQIYVVKKLVTEILSSELIHVSLCHSRSEIQ